MKEHKTTAGESIIASLKEALRYSRGEEVPGIRVTTVMVPTIDVRGVPRKLKLSQNEFAAKFGSSPAVVRNWEQGRNRPDGAARVFLAVIDRHPEAVEDALRKSA
jgi:putative transcriptional regulator